MATTVLSFTSVNMSFGSTRVLDAASFSVQGHDKIALIGRNGSGKSTILKLAAGLLDPDQGTVQRPVTIGYVPQDYALVEEGSVVDYIKTRAGLREYESQIEELLGEGLGDEVRLSRYSELVSLYDQLGGWELEASAGKALTDVGLSPEYLERSIGTLSGGERVRVGLAATLISRQDLLLLDEPTNNLDLSGITLLETFLEETRSAVLLVSHDRRLLETISAKTLLLDHHTGGVRMYQMSFMAYEDAVKLEQVAAERRFQEFEMRRESIRAAITRTKMRAQASSHQKPSDNEKMARHARGERSANKKERARRSLEKQLERLEEVPQPITDEPPVLSIASSSAQGVAFKLDGVTLQRQNFKLGPIFMEVRLGDRLAIVGHNGSGKSTLLQILNGSIEPTSGERWVRRGLRLSYLDQHHATLSDELTPREILRNSGATAASSVHALVKLGFSRDDAIVTPVANLSPGMRARVLLALMSVAQTDVILLDEPTNHVDFSVAEAVEAAIRDFPGTLIVVSHDRKFLEEILVDRLIELEDGQVASNTLIAAQVN